MQSEKNPGNQTPPGSAPSSSQFVPKTGPRVDSHESQAAAHLRKYNRTASVLLTDFAAVAIPLVCLGFTLGLYLHNGKPVNEQELWAWRNGLIAFASIFPIAFAIIVGRLMHQLGRYTLERGTTIGTLEQLNGSRSFGGTITTQITLGGLNMLGVGIVLLWILSPLGTQSLLRVLETYPKPLYDTVTAYYSHTSAGTSLPDMYFVSPSDGNRFSQFFSPRAIQLATSMQLPRYAQLDTMDLWGNVKIPFLGGAYDNKTMHTPQKDWEELVWTPDTERYSAFTGIQMVSLPAGNTTVSVESSYIDLNCYNVTKYFPGILHEEVSWNWTGGARSEGWVEGEPAKNGTWQGFHFKPDPNATTTSTESLGGNWIMAVDRFVNVNWTQYDWLESRLPRLVELEEELQEVNLDREWDDQIPASDELSSLRALLEGRTGPAIFAAMNETRAPADPTRLFFYAHIASEEGHMQPAPGISAYCDVRQKYVETRVLCKRADMATRQNCTAVAQRPSRKPHASELISTLNFPMEFDNLAKRLPAATVMGTADLALEYRYLGEAVEGDAVDEVAGGDFKADNLLFSRRLSQIINTYLLLASYDITKDEATSSNGTLEDDFIAHNVSAPAVVQTSIETYRISDLWVALAFVCGAIFLASGIASVVFTHLSNGPEVLGYASTVVRDSKFMDLPPESSHMSAADVSRMIKHQRVRYGYSEMTRQGQPLLGVGPEGEMLKLKDAHRSGL